MPELETTTTGWKQKYFAALEEVETRERLWLDAERLLRRSLHRLSLVVPDQHPDLTDQLVALREWIRLGTDYQELLGIVGAIENTLAILDAQTSESMPVPVPFTPDQILDTLLQQVDFPRGMRHRALSLQQDLRLGTEADQEQRIAAVVLLLSEAMAWNRENSAATFSGAASPAHPMPSLGAGLLTRLRKWVGKSPEAEAGVVSLDTISLDNALPFAREIVFNLLQALMESATHRHYWTSRLATVTTAVELRHLAEELSALFRLTAIPDLDVRVNEDEEQLEVGGTLALPTSNAEVEITSADTKALLLQLVERLEVLPEFARQRETILALLTESESLPDFAAVISAIVDLVAGMHDQLLRDKEEIEQFLQQMTERLHEVDSTLQENVAIHQKSYSEGREFDRNVQVQVLEIEESVSEARDLALLKVALRRRVETIRRHMKEYRQAEEARIERAERQVEVLNERLRFLQDESDQLRQRLKEERDLALLDPLTGIPNRIAYNERVEQEMARWRRYQSPLVLVIWDIDCFKQINDRFGHQAGDKVLVTVARVLRSKIRETDFVARFGGEEFTMLFPETSLAHAEKVVEQIRLSVAACAFHFREQPVNITVSAGLTEFRTGDESAQVFQRADEALYQAKSTGRNRCIST